MEETALHTIGIYACQAALLLADRGKITHSIWQGAEIPAGDFHLHVRISEQVLLYQHHCAASDAYHDRCHALHRSNDKDRPKGDLASTGTLEQSEPQDVIP